MKISIIRKVLIIFIWLLVWQLGAIIISNDIVLVGPIEVLRELMLDAVTWDFWKTILVSLGKIGLGFFVSFFLGIAFGFLSYRFTILKELLSPPVLVLKSIPVASFVVLLLLWAGASYLSFFVVMLIVFPHIYVGTLKGLEGTDEKLLQMADAYEFGWKYKCIYIYKDALKKNLEAACILSLGLAWKSGVAAEVIGLPDFSIGLKIYMSKIYLDTPKLFAWTVVVILLCFLFEKVLLFFINCALGYAPCPSCARKSFITKDGTKTNGTDTYTIDEFEDEINDINVTYGDKTVLENVSIHVSSGQIYTLMAPSGRGKTTLLNEIKNRTTHQVSIMFQEDRLLENYDVLTNVMLGASRILKKECREIVEKILPTECIFMPCGKLSGGMKRRVSLLRALLRDSEYLLLDEPFSGMDEDTKADCIKLIKEYQNNRCVIVITHQKEDEKELGGIRLECL